MSEEYRRVQYVSVTDPLYPKLHGKALPVTRWVLSHRDEIQAVYVLMGCHEIMFQRNQVKLYHASDEQIVLVTQQHTGGLFNRLKKFLTTPHQR